MLMLFQIITLGVLVGMSLFTVFMILLLDVPAVRKYLIKHSTKISEEIGNEIMREDY